MRTRGALIFLLILLAGLLVLCFRIAQPFFGPIIAAMVMAVALAPVHRALLRRLDGRRTPAALASTLLGLLLILVPLGVLAYSLSNEVQDVYASLRAKSVEEGGWGPFFNQIVERPLNRISTVLPVSDEALRAEIVQRVGGLSQALVRMTRSTLTHLVNSLFNVGFTALLLFFFVRDGDRLLRHLAGFLPLSAKQIHKLADAVARTTVANVHGVLVVAGAQGMLLFIGLWILGVRPAVVWALTGAFCSMIPVLGAATVWVILSIALFLQEHFWKGLILVLWGSLIVSTADNILRPLVVGSHARQHPMLVFFAIIGGLRAFGLVGLLLGPIVVAVTLAVLDLLRDEVRAAPAQDPAAAQEGSDKSDKSDKSD